MRKELKKKAWLITIILSLALLGLGFGLGRLMPLEQAQETGQLIEQATEKVLTLTREKQILEQEIQNLLGRAPGDSSAVWQYAGAYYGLLRLGQGVVFNNELGVELLGSQPESQQAEIFLSWQGQKSKLQLKTGQKFELNNNWHLAVEGQGNGWVVLRLQQK